MAANYFQRLQEESQKFLKNLTSTQKILLGTIGVVTIASVIFVTIWAQQPEWTTLYANLGEKDAGEIVKRVKDANIQYTIQTNKDGVIIKVPSKNVHDMRLQLATDGLPKEGGVVGFELFDKDNLGVTNNQFNLNRQRALEGELARTIMQNEAVERARVHLALPKKQVFTELSEDTTASVILKLAPEKQLERSQVKGISKLVAGGVPGLEQRNVTITDTLGNILFDKEMLEEDGEQKTAKLNEEQLDYQRTVEQQIRQDVNKMLAKIVGAENVNTQVKADIDFDKEDIKSTTYTPNASQEDLRAIRSERTTAEAGRGKNVTPGGVPGVSTNIPSYQESSGEGNTAFSREDSIKNYEIPETETHRVKSTGTIKRLTVSVAVNSSAAARALGLGENVELEQEDIQRVEELVAAAAGIDKSRGDLVTVQPMQFDDTALKAEVASMERDAQREFWRSILAMGLLIIGVIALLLALYMAFGRRRVPPDQEFLDEDGMLLEAPSDEEEEGEEVVLALHEPPEMLELSEAAAKRAAAVKSLTQMAKEDPANMARLLRAWMTEG